MERATVQVNLSEANRPVQPGHLHCASRTEELDAKDGKACSWLPH